MVDCGLLLSARFQSKHALGTIPNGCQLSFLPVAAILGCCQGKVLKSELDLGGGRFDWTTFT